MKTQELVQDVIETGKKIAKRHTQRFPEAASVGDCFRQGDVYFMLLDKLPRGAKSVKNPSLQLAPGSTQGSRHILDSAEGVKMFALPDATEFDGPILQLECEREITHPEHGHIVIPVGIYAVAYQRTQDGLDRARRVQD